MFRKAILTLCAVVLSSGISLAAPQSNAVRDVHVEAQLIAEGNSIAPAQSFWVALRLKMDSQWHVYWKNPGDSGTPPKIKWHLPEGFKAGDIQWPYPTKIDQPPLRTYGYEEEVFLLVKIDPPSQLTGETVTLKARTDWLMCKIECIPGRAELEFQLPVSSEPPQPNSPWIKHFADTRARLPLEESGWAIAAQDHNRTLTIRLNNPDAYKLSDVYFFPERDDLINHADEQILKEVPGGYELAVTRSNLFTKPLTRLKGILVSKEGWRGPDTEAALTVDIPVGAPTQTPLKLPAALLFAFIGGLILNLMPCVLPVLSLKVLGLIKQAGEDRSKMRLHGLIFTAGVVVSFWVLAGILIALRAAGQQIGWGFQFQSPPFLIFLSLVFLIFALNLFGVFEIAGPQINAPRKQGMTGIFLNGVLATITATPCTAPFMGTALGFALSQSPQVALGIFTSLGLGMSSPYLLLTFFPPLLRLLPKPGPWMIKFKKFLGVLLLATVVWLLWVLGTQVGFLKDGPASQETSSAKIVWQNYSPELIEQLRAENKIVFLDFTARWCLTCQVNERIALDNAKVVEKFKELGVVAVKADWTSYDETITRALAAFGKNSIPLYVLYPKDQKEPVILPEIITPGTVLEALKKISR
jgi:DsbC/DsbD-like thiol-disulfide interchange protein/cytochrome c biogenesis protein CcdA